MCDVCGVSRDPATCVACGHEDFRWDGEGGFYALRCRLGHEWWARYRRRSHASPGEYVPATCPRCGLEGRSEDD